MQHELGVIVPTFPWLCIQLLPFVLQGSAPLAETVPLVPFLTLWPLRAWDLLSSRALHPAAFVACSQVYHCLAWAHLRVLSGCDSTPSTEEQKKRH